MFTSWDTLWTQECCSKFDLALDPGVAIMLSTRMTFDLVIIRTATVAFNYCVPAPRKLSTRVVAVVVTAPGIDLVVLDEL